MNTTSPIPEILFLSKLTESKGVLVLLSALEILKVRGKRFKCTLVGGEADVTFETLRRDLDKKGLTNDVVVMGRQYGKTKQRAYEQADIFAFPTFFNNECFPLVLLEAMQHSLPVVTTYEGGIPDIVVDGVTGFMVPQHDVKALADKLEILLDDESLRLRMGIAGRQRYEENFTHHHFENRLLGILKQCVEKV